VTRPAACARYSMRITWSDEDNMFVAVCPELGCLSALGVSQESAARELERAIMLALETYRAQGWLIPAHRIISS